MARRCRGDNASTTVELAVVMPVLGLLLTALIQFGVWFHARQVAAAAARHAVEATRREGGSPQAGASALQQWLEQVGDETLNVSGLTISDGAIVRVTVTGQAADVIPGPWTVSVTVQGPKEQPVP